MLRWCNRILPAVALLALCAGVMAASAGLSAQGPADPVEILDDVPPQPDAIVNLVVPDAQEAAPLSAMERGQPLLIEAPELDTLTASAPAVPLSLTDVDAGDSPLLRNMYVPPRSPMVEQIVIYTYDRPAPEQAPVVVPTFNEVLRGAPALNMLLIFVIGLLMAHYGARSLRLRR
jgi:hypothetical protein